MQQVGVTNRKTISEMGGGVRKPLRDSNLELLRIFSMLAIIAHHYVVNSTVMAGFDNANPSLQQYFLSLWGMWGKTAINSFILISGYFLCKGNFTWQRWVKLFAQMLFYGYLIMLIFALTGYAPITWKSIIGQLTGFLSSINRGFGASFMAFYAFVPVYNQLISSLSKRQHGVFVCGLILIFSFTDTFFFGGVFNEPFWYMALYMIAAFIRLYPNRYTENLSLCIGVLFASIVAAMVSVAVLTATGRGMLLYFFVSDSDKLFALMVGLSAFLVAKNVPQFQNCVVNFFSAGTFGVLLIHASSDTMRQWLWQDVCQVPSMLTAPMPTLVLHAVAIPPIIFVICSSVDWLRRRYLEIPFMNWLYAVTTKTAQQTNERQ